MKIERSTHNPISAKEVYVMLSSQAFQERKCRDAGALSYAVTIEQSSDRAVVKTRRKLPSTGFPGILRKFVPTSVTSTETITWAAEAPDGSRTAELSVEFHGTPATMKGTIRVIADGPDAATVVVDADFKAHVPLIGGKIEAFAAPIILGVIDAEEETGKAWAAGVR